MYSEVWDSDAASLDIVVEHSLEERRVRVFGQ